MSKALNVSVFMSTVCGRVVSYSIRLEKLRVCVCVCVCVASRCGKCRRYLKLIIAKPTRLHCATCDETLSVPQNCNVRLYKELRCPLDDYELLYCTTGTGGKVSRPTSCCLASKLI